VSSNGARGGNAPKLPRVVFPKYLLPRARGGEGALASSCRAPQGHNQTPGDRRRSFSPELPCATRSRLNPWRFSDICGFVQKIDLRPSQVDDFPTCDYLPTVASRLLPDLRPPPVEQKIKKIKKQKGKPGNQIGDVDLRRPSVKTKLKIYMEKRPITG